MAKFDFGGTIETVITHKEFPIDRVHEMLDNEVIAIIGYGIQGSGQSLNLRDNGFNVIVGQRKISKSYKKALEDGWIEDQTLFTIEKALEKGTIIMYLLSDAAQIQLWSTVKTFLTPGKTLCFAHGFGIVYNHQTGIIPPKNIDVILVAPKGSGTTFRKLFVSGKGLNSSFSIHQNSSGKAKEKAIAIGISIGSKYLFETTFKKEVHADLTGERGILVGALAGIMEAQYNLLRSKGHSPSESFNETVEELTESLIKLVSEKGMDWMYANCSTTAQRGALDWKNKFRDAVVPVFNDLYESVVCGKESQRAIDTNKQSDYREKLQVELQAISNSEMWRTGEQIRKLRPDNQ